MVNFNTRTRLFIPSFGRTGQFAHIFGRILLITFFEFLNFYRTTDFTMQNVVSRIISITRNITGQGFYLVWSKVNGLRSKWAIRRVQSEWSGSDRLTSKSRIGPTKKAAKNLQFHRFRPSTLTEDRPPVDPEEPKIPEL